MEADRGELRVHPPGEGIRPLLLWLAQFRAFPEAILPGEAVARLKRASRQRLATRVETPAGPAWGVSLKGERALGLPLRGIARLSLRGAGERALVVLGLAHLAQTHPNLEVVGSHRHGLLVSLDPEGPPKLIGWEKGDLPVGLEGEGYPIGITLPHTPLGDHPLTDREWLAIAPLLLHPPTIPYKGRWTTRTLVDGTILLRELGRKAFLEAYPRELLWAVLWFGRKRGENLRLACNRVPRICGSSRGFP